MGKRKGKMSN